LFDLDGTLLDTAPDLVGALFRLCAEEHQPLPDYELAAQHVSTGAIGLVRLAFPDHDEQKQELLRRRLVDAYAANLHDNTRFYPGMEDLLEHIETAGVRWGVVTNKIAELTEPLLEQLGLRRRMGTVVSGDSAAERKPHPAPVLLALEELGVAPEKTVYVGDAPQDIAAGKAAGTLTIAARWGYIIPGTNPNDWQADYTIDSPDEIAGLPALR
ncbi:MAG: HAD-IA family hydrolase, partial [Gammaproteobacteria bacterium]|nr:HAD-IA family hydrolase [Gammaproteobacteria bacterium]